VLLVFRYVGSLPSRQHACFCYDLRSLRSTRCGSAGRYVSSTVPQEALRDTMGISISLLHFHPKGAMRRKYGVISR